MQVSSRLKSIVRCVELAVFPTKRPHAIKEIRNVMSAEPEHEQENSNSREGGQKLVFEEEQSPLVPPSRAKPSHRAPRQRHRSKKKTQHATDWRRGRHGQNIPNTATDGQSGQIAIEQRVEGEIERNGPQADPQERGWRFCRRCVRRGVASREITHPDMSHRVSDVICEPNSNQRKGDDESQRNQKPTGFSRIGIEPSREKCGYHRADQTNDVGKL